MSATGTKYIGHLNGDRDDLVLRLRESVRACRAVDRSELLEQAAAEIERLRGFFLTVAAIVDVERMRR